MQETCTHAARGIMDPACRLVASALDMLIPLIPLDEEVDAAPRKEPSRQSAVAQAAAAAQARAAGAETGWSMAAELQQLGEMTVAQLVNRGCA